MRSGDEPDHARSQLRLCLVLATIGFLSWATAALVLLVRDDLIRALGCGVGLAWRSSTSRSYWSGSAPGRTVPPYRPVEPTPGTPRAPGPSDAPPDGSGYAGTCCPCSPAWPSR